MNRQQRRSLRQSEAPAAPLALADDTLINQAELLNDMQRLASPEGIPASASPPSSSPPSPQPITVGAAPTPTAHSPVPPAPRTPNVRHPLSATSPVPLTWLWHDRIPLGALTILDGDTSSGKSLIALTLAACVTSGRPFPGALPTDPAPAKGTVLIIAPYDNLATVVRPRFEAAGGDSARASALNLAMIRDSETGLPNSLFVELPQDLSLLEEYIDSISPTLVIIDPWLALLKKHPRGQDALMQSLASLDEIAQRTGCAILLLRSTRTSRGDLLRPRFVGSPQYHLISSALLLVPHPDEEHSFFLLPSRHMLGPTPAPLAYHIRANDHDIPIIDWLDDAHTQLATICGSVGSHYCQHRHAILRFLQEHPGLQPIEAILAAISQSYEPGRKMLQRMVTAGDIDSPSRGLYSLPDPVAAQPPAPVGFPTAVPIAVQPPAPDDEPTSVGARLIAPQTSGGASPVATTSTVSTSSIPRVPSVPDVLTHPDNLYSLSDGDITAAQDPSLNRLPEKAPGEINHVPNVPNVPTVTDPAEPTLCSR